MSALRIPEISPDSDALTAALAYAAAGWYVVPVKRGTKHPGSILGNGWHSRSTRDPKQITAWFAGTDHGIALHVGRSGAVVFDVDDVDALPDVLRGNFGGVPYQSTRPDTPGRGHYVFAQPPDRTLGNGTGRLGGAWGEVRGLNGVIVVAPTPHVDGGHYDWKIAGTIPALADEIAEQLDDATPASDAASDATVAAFIANHQQATRPVILRGWTSALRKRIAEGESRHAAAVTVVTGALKEARAGHYSAQVAVAELRPMFLDAVAKPPASGKQGASRNGHVAVSEWDGIVAWAVGQANGADLETIRVRTAEKMPNNVAWIDNIAAPHSAKLIESTGDTNDDGETVRTVPWPTLSDAALHGTAGTIVSLVAPHTEADPAAILVQLLAVFGATLGPGPHIVAGNERHRAVIAPLIVGRTNNGAKGTGLGVVEAIRKLTLPWFDEFTTSGLSSAEGLIELVRDPSGDPNDKDYDPGVSDKRLLVKESEYRSVLARCRREGNTLSMTLRQAWDGGTLRTLARKHNKLTATDPHIVVIGHITPREFRSTLDDSDLSGGSINRLLLCLSRRARLNARLGNIPHNVLTTAADLFVEAQKAAQNRGEMTFTDAFWSSWETTYRELNRDRPDSWATDATARGVTQVLRLALIYALFDGAEEIDTSHLDAALSLWAYAEHSAKWLFSTHELEIEREAAGGLANFIREGGCEGRTRTEIYRDYFKSNIKAAEITAELTPLVHDGVVIEIKDETGARPITRYVHRSLRIDAFTDYAGQEANPTTYPTDYVRIDSPVEPAGPGANTSEYVANAYSENPPDLQNPSNTLIRNRDDPACRYCGAGLPYPSAQARGYCSRATCLAAHRDGTAANGQVRP
jgi:hypothetical protein